MIIEVVAAVIFCSAMCSPILLIIAFAALLLILNATAYSAIWAVMSSGIIAQERENSTYDLYCVSPEGALGTNWALCTGLLHRNQRLEQVSGILRSLLMVVLGIVGIISVVILAHTLQTQNDLFLSGGIQRVMIMIIHVLAVMTIIYLDHVQSIVLAILVSILVPSYGRNRLDAQVGTLGFFLFLQLTSYLLALAFAFGILPAIYFQSDEFIVQVSLTLFQVASIFVIREATVTYVWRLLKQRLDIASGEESAIPLSPFKPGLKPQ